MSIPRVRECPAVKHSIHGIRNKTGSKRPSTFRVFAAASREKSVKIEPPPADYNYRHALYKQSRAYVYKHYPQLSDLAEDGTLMVVQRPEDYVERREDG